MIFHSRSCFFHSSGHSIFRPVVKGLLTVLAGLSVLGSLVNDARAIDFKTYLKGAQAEITRHKNNIAEDPLDAIEYFELGKSYLALGRHEEEVEAYKEAIKLNPKYTEAHYNLGMAYDLLNDGANAVKHILIALDLYTQKRNHARIRSVQRQLKFFYLKYPRQMPEAKAGGRD